MHNMDSFRPGDLYSINFGQYLKDYGDRFDKYKSFVESNDFYIWSIIDVDLMKSVKIKIFSPELALLINATWIHFTDTKTYKDIWINGYHFQSCFLAGYKEGVTTFQKTFAQTGNEDYVIKSIVDILPIWEARSKIFPAIHISYEQIFEIGKYSAFHCFGYDFLVKNFPAFTQLNSL